MRFLSLNELIELHKKLILQSGGSQGVRDVDGVESSLAQPLAFFSG